VKLLLLLTLLTTPAFAQKAPDRTCRLLFLNGPDAAPDTLHLFDGVSSQEVELPRMNFSKIYKLRPGALTLGLLPDAVDDPETIPAGLPIAKVAAGVTDFYLLVTSDPANKVAPVRMQVINAGADKLKRGQMLWFNLTKNPVMGMVGSEKLAIKPASRVTIAPPARGNVDYPVQLDFRIPGKEPLYPLCETNWRHDSRSRSVPFIITEQGRRSPRVLVFPDYREAPPKKP